MTGIKSLRSWCRVVYSFPQSIQGKSQYIFLKGLWVNAGLECKTSSNTYTKVLFIAFIQFMRNSLLLQLLL